MTGKNEGCGSGKGTLGSYGFLGSYHYEFDFTQWEGQVCMHGVALLI